MTALKRLEALDKRRSVTERRALGWLSILALAAIIFLAAPFASALLLGILMGFTLEGAFKWLARRTARPQLSALLIVLLSALAVGSAVAGFVTLFITRAIQIASQVRDQLQSDGPLRHWLDSISRWLSRFDISADSMTTRLEAGAGEIASHIAEYASAFAAGTLGVVLGLFFALLAMHLVLLKWPAMIKGVVDISPLRADHTQALLQEFRRVGRVTVFGTVATGLAQGGLASLGFWMSGVPSPIFLGVATAIASLIPAVGTMLIWIPAGLYLIAIGNPGHAALELTWGALMVVGFSDYVIRPRLVGDEESVTLLVFVALFGGVEAFGLPGLILGPVLMAMAVATLRVYAGESAAHDEPPRTPGEANDRMSSGRRGGLG